MLTKAVFAMTAAAVLAGCATPHSPVPIASNFPSTKQEKLQAAAHWGVIANSMSQQLITELKKGPQRPFYIAEPSQASPFQRALTIQLISALVNQGQVVSRAPAGALRVDLDVQAYTFAPNRPQSRYAGVPAAIGTGVWMLADIDPGFAVAAGAAGFDGYNWYSSQYAAGDTPQTELLITASVSDQFRYYARSTAAYYVADSDRALYGIKDEAPKEPQVTKLFNVRGDR
jgi:hypothetical protein